MRQQRLGLPRGVIIHFLMGRCSIIKETSWWPTPATRGAGARGTWAGRCESSRAPRRLKRLPVGFASPMGSARLGRIRIFLSPIIRGRGLERCKLNPVKDGGFYGHPGFQARAPRIVRWTQNLYASQRCGFRTNLARSSSGMCEIKDDRFGAVQSGSCWSVIFKMQLSRACNWKK